MYVFEQCMNNHKIITEKKLNGEWKSAHCTVCHNRFRWHSLDSWLYLEKSSNIIREEKELIAKKLVDFKSDLKELLIKHNAELGLSIDGDTHGIYDEGIDVSFVLPKREGDHHNRVTDCIKIGDSSGIEVRDL